MEYINKLDNYEIKFVCDKLIPISHIKEYFYKYTKKIKRYIHGFDNISEIDEEQRKFLYDNIKEQIIYSFVENEIKEYLNIIEKKIIELEKLGHCREESVLTILSLSLFQNDLDIYYKLIGEEYSEEYVKMVKTSIIIIKKLIAENISIRLKMKEKINYFKEKLLEQILKKLNDAENSINTLLNEKEKLTKINKEVNKTLDESKNNIKKLELKFDNYKQNKEQKIINLKNKLKEISSRKEEKIKDLELQFQKKSEENNKIKDLEFQLQKNSEDSEKIINSLIADLQKKENNIQEINSELNTLKEKLQINESTAINERENQQNLIGTNEKSLHVPKRPKDINKFKENLGLNLERVDDDIFYEQFFDPLKEYLSEILFLGKPIIINRNVGLTLIKCVANVLIGTEEVMTLTFSENINENNIIEFLEKNNRIVCFDNFIGNFNEMILLTITDKYKDCIIFFTILYDRTLSYLSEEFIKYCQYLNLNRIETFSKTPYLNGLSDIPEEVIITKTDKINNIRLSTSLKNILLELGFSESMSIYISSHIKKKDDLFQLLAFNIIPYCVDVLKIKPFHMSEKLNISVGKISSCPYKDLFINWFYND
jgi:hypothetical protein